QTKQLGTMDLAYYPGEHILRFTSYYPFVNLKIQESFGRPIYGEALAKKGVALLLEFHALREIWRRFPDIRTIEHTIPLMRRSDQLQDRGLTLDEIQMGIRWKKPSFCFRSKSHEKRLKTKKESK
ncbi:MAG: hypothetical protein Q7R47_04120, partial [Candidatus Diapherotrites archaeon]|nr:hypothetical protein [Candidatus Diapherotrites archaeon]